MAEVFLSSNDGELSAPVHHLVSHPSVILDSVFDIIFNLGVSALVLTYTFLKQFRYVSLSFTEPPLPPGRITHSKSPGVYFRNLNFFLTCFDTIFLLPELNSFSKEIFKLITAWLLFFTSREG